MKRISHCVAASKEVEGTACGVNATARYYTKSPTSFCTSVDHTGDRISIYKALETDEPQMVLDESDAWDRTTGEIPELP